MVACDPSNYASVVGGVNFFDEIEEKGGDGFSLDFVSPTFEVIAALNDTNHAKVTAVRDNDVIVLSTSLTIGGGYFSDLKVRKGWN